MKYWNKYELRCHYCGATQNKTLWWLKIRLIFTDKIHYNCPICHHKNVYINIFHLRHDSTDKEEKTFNKLQNYDWRIK